MAKLPHKRPFCIIIMVSGIIFIIIILFLFILNPNNPNTHPASSQTMKSDVVGSLKNYNLIIINIDALRADHLSCYGYQRNTSPFIDFLAKSGMVFEKAMSNSSFTRESVSVLFSGRLPSSGGSVGWGARPSKKIKRMGELFKDAGYKTAFFSNSNVIKDKNFTKGFQAFWFCEKWGVSQNGPKLSNRAGDFIEKHNGQKFMMYLHYLDPHGPYHPSSNCYLRFAKTIYPNPLSLYNYVRKNCASLIKEGFGPGEVRFEDMVLRYDAEIAHIDKSIEIVFCTLEKYNLLNNTLLVITSDHGEEFIEHNYVEHGWTLYNESLHIPLIFWAPMVITSKRITSIVSTVDILPTLVELIEIPHKRNDFDGSCLFEYRDEGFHFKPPQKPFIAELLIQHRNIIRAVIKDNWKYITSVKWLKPHERPNALKNVREFEGDKKLHLNIWGKSIHEELYDLSSDPKEKNNLLDKNKEKHCEFREILRRYKIYCHIKGLNNFLGSDNKIPLSEKDRKKLKSLGYL